MTHKKILFIAFSFLFLLTGICPAQEDSASDEKQGEDSVRDENIKKKDNAEKKDDPEKKDDQQGKHNRMGNYALPYSQQPSPLMSFGQNLVGKNQTQAFLRADKLGGSGTQTLALTPSIFYGVTDDLAFSFNAPIALKNEVTTEDGIKRSSGLADVFFQGEYSFYSTEGTLFDDQATVVGNVYLPTGSYKKEPPTGSGSPSFFLGGTFCRTYTDWIYFTSHGVTLKTPHNGIKDGNEFLYECGVGKNIYYLDSEWIVTGMIEANGKYTGRSKIRNSTPNTGANIIIDPNSGGNTIYVSPSIFVSTKKVVFQVGFGLPINQNLFGNQKKNNYLIAVNFGWLF